jgi:glycosyltransferase involved in cell wall biosynthesis
MLVTVIIPAFNHVRFIDECVGSVLAQDHPKLEVIVVDDGSTDGTLERLQAYGERITLLQQRGGRQARARNLALRAARGELVAFLDSDDRYRPARIRLAVEAFRADPAADLVWGDYRRIDADGAPIDEARWTPRCEDFRRELIAGNPICNATVTVRRAALDEIGGFDERVPRVCDGAAWYQMAARGRRFVHLDELLLDYRVHGANDSRGFAAMTRDRDTALTSAVQAYLRFGVIADEPPQRRWLRDVLTRQFAFRAAAWVQRELERGVSGRVLAQVYDTLGSDAGLALLARLQSIKHALRPRAGAGA